MMILGGYSFSRACQGIAFADDQFAKVYKYADGVHEDVEKAKNTYPTQDQKVFVNFL